jgi:hypothetical protein
MLIATDGEAEHRIQSRFCLSLEEAHRVIESWGRKYYIAPGDVQDNSRLDMNELLKGMETDFSVTQN